MLVLVLVLVLAFGLGGWKTSIMLESIESMRSSSNSPLLLLSGGDAHICSERIECCTFERGTSCDVEETAAVYS